MKLNALYYPYTSIHSIDTLKILSMYFDTVYFLGPRPIYNGNYEDKSTVVKAFEELNSRRLVGLIRPADIVSSYHEILDCLIQNDIAGKTFSKLSGRPWHLYVEKVPEETLARYFGRTKNDRTVLVSFELGESVILNHTLLSCGLLDFFPLTDEAIHFRALEKKVNAIMRALGVNEAPSFNIKLKLPCFAGLSLADTMKYVDQDSLTINRAKKSLQRLVHRLAGGSFEVDSPAEMRTMLEEIETSLASVRMDLRQFSQKRQGSSVVEVPVMMRVYIDNSWRKLLQNASRSMNLSAFAQRISPESSKYKNAVSFFIDPRYLLPSRNAISKPSLIIKGLTREGQRTVQPGSATMEDLLNCLNLK
jgi:hypothetical protein